MIEREECHDCGVLEGELHDFGCDTEKCPSCGEQLITCDCDHSELTDETRIPFILWPIFCARCGMPWPEFFTVDSEEWRRYIEPAQRDKVICLRCYREITALIDGLDIFEEEVIAKPYGKRPQFSTAQKREILLNRGPVCTFCKKYTHEGDRHYHHIIPISCGGPNDIKNGGVSHIRCHIEYHKTMDFKKEFMEYQPGDETDGQAHVDQSLLRQLAPWHAAE